ncbi:MAG TPA: hypothetical protein VFQ87_09420 [Bradyrhizobium sp.]|jgi:hypothetical protein|nr:hypothetical protein [Bradyrhizobium sp.]
MTAVPDEFLQLAHAFHQDSRIGIANEQEWIVRALASLDLAQRRVVKTFLTELLIHCHDDSRLRKLWNETGADFYIRGDQGGRYFLALIRDSI